MSSYLYLTHVQQWMYYGIGVLLIVHLGCNAVTCRNFASWVLLIGVLLIASHSVAWSMGLGLKHDSKTAGGREEFVVDEPTMMAMEITNMVGDALVLVGLGTEITKRAATALRNPRAPHEPPQIA